jgi:hypothetical protein
MTCQSGAITPKVGGVLTPQIHNKSLALDTLPIVDMEASYINELITHPIFVIDE